MNEKRKRIQYQRVFVSKQIDRTLQVQEMNDWRDGQIDIERNVDPDRETAFVYDKKQAKVTMMAFDNREDMEEELGELIPDMEAVVGDSNAADFTFYASSEVTV